jgi:AbrB family looped-hinge helix DNA binding protein
MRITATITSKGQITIPKAIREQLRGSIVEFSFSDGVITLRELPSVEGSLASYADAYIPLEEVREQTFNRHE